MTKTDTENHSELIRWAWILPLLSAVFYTVSNSCMRHLAGMGADHYSVLAIRESIAFFFAAPIFLWMLFAGRTKRPKWRHFLIFIGLSLCVQLFGNVVLQKAFGVIGMAVSLAGNWTGVLLGAPLLGFLVLGERPSRQMLVSVSIIFFAMLCLTVGVRMQEAEMAREKASHVAVPAVPPFSEPVTSEPGESAEGAEAWGSWKAAFQVLLLLTVGAGLTSAVINVWIRKMAQEGYSTFFSMTMLPGTGFIFLSLINLRQNGFSLSGTLSGWEYFWAYGAGFANLFGFLFITLSLRYLSVVRVSTLNIFQLALAPVVGLLIFRENMNFWISLGILMTMVGIVAGNIKMYKEQCTVDK